jgi:hypothetical protein
MVATLTDPRVSTERDPSDRLERRASSGSALTKRVTIAAVAVAGVALVVASTVAIGRATFDREMSRDVTDLFAASIDGQPTVLTEADLAALPEPVQRWLRYSQVVGTERPVAVRLKQEGEFRLGEGRDWMPFEAEQYFTTDPPGFVWIVSMRMFPLVTVTGRDRYVEGESSIRMRLLSLLPVADESGSKLDQGALLRYLGEMPWFPAAAVSPYITWEGIDASSARATISYGGVTGSATFLFDQEGRLTEVVAQRYNSSKDRLETWSAPTHAYGEIGGVRFGVEGEAIWRYETGDFSYIRLRITEVEYNRPVRY